MMKNKWCYRNNNLGLLLLRLALGVIFVAHGWAKFMAVAGTTKFFAGMGLASFWVYVVAAVELFGGLAILVGFGTFIAGILLAIDMLVVIFMVKLSKGLLGGYELELILLAASLALALVGPGKYSIGSKMGGNNHYDT